MPRSRSARNGGSGPALDGPGGPTGPGRRSRGRNDDPDARRKSKKRKWVNMLIASFAVFIMLAGLGVVGFTYYSTNVVLPNQVPLPLATTVLMSDGKGLVAKLGSENREFVTISQIPVHVQRAVAAAEDRNFYEHSGVDYKGIVRAAWNNFTGGTKQGASTITQQYAKNAYENLKDISYARKVKEAILASKLNDQYSKDEIMQHYLNTIYFGRGAYGVEAAAKAYFGKSAKDLDVAEAAALAGVIKQPVGNDAHPGYDPTKSPEAAKAALDRWNYVIGGMVEEGWLKASERPTEFPKMNEEKSNGFGVGTPKGNVINYVRKEMEQWGMCSDSGAEDKISCVEALRTGGYRVTTTINPAMQKAAEDAARSQLKSSPLNGHPDNLMAAIVAIDPKTGAVRAYYGGESGTDIDYAGFNTDQNGDLSGGHPPGSTFKVYTLAAAINEGISVKSHWDAKPFKPEGFADEIGNAGRDISGGCNRWCTLEESTVESYNVPFYHVAKDIGPAKVLEMIRQAGITTMWTRDPVKAYDLMKSKPNELAPSKFDEVMAYGQFPVTVIDHANGLATLANEGKYNKAHFVTSIEQQNKATGKWEKVPGTGPALKPQQRIKRDVAREVTAVLKKIPGSINNALSDGRQAAGKTGTWQYANTRNNADAWMVGYTPQLAAAVWIGSKDPQRPKIKDRNGNDIGGGGMPADVWEKFMNGALKGKEKQPLPEITGVGDPNKGNGIKPEPVAPVAPPPGQDPNAPCLDPLGILCPGGPGAGTPGGPTGPGAPPGPGNPAAPPPGGGGGGGGETAPTNRYSEDD